MKIKKTDIKRLRAEIEEREKEMGSEKKAKIDNIVNFIEEIMRAPVNFFQSAMKEKPEIAKKLIGDALSSTLLTSTRNTDDCYKILDRMRKHIDDFDKVLNKK